MISFADHNYPEQGDDWTTESAIVDSIIHWEVTDTSELEETSRPSHSCFLFPTESEDLWSVKTLFWGDFYLTVLSVSMDSEARASSFLFCWSYRLQGAAVTLLEVDPANLSNT